MVQVNRGSWSFTVTRCFPSHADPSDPCNACEGMKGTLARLRHYSDSRGREMLLCRLTDGEPRLSLYLCMYVYM